MLGSSVSIAVVVVTDKFDHFFEKTVASLQGSSDSVDRLYIISPLSPSYALISFDVGKCVFIRDQGLGVYEAMNCILALDQIEDYIIFLNAGDEMLRPDYLGDCKKLLNRTGDISAVISGYKTSYRKPLGRLFGVFLGEREVRPQLNAKRIKQSSFLLNSSVFFDLNGFNCKYRFAADYDLFLKFLSKNSVELIDVISSVFYLDGISSKNRLGSLRDQELVTKQNPFAKEDRKLLHFGLFQIKKLRAIFIDFMRI